MTSAEPPSLNSLVVYKLKAAHVIETNKKKLTIRLADGEQVSVRPKDILLLHPGPVKSLHDLAETAVLPEELLTAWELLGGEEITLPDLCELAFAEYSPRTAWTTWQAVADGLYFQGTPTAVLSSSKEQVAETIAARARKEEEQRAWEEFLSRLDTRQFEQADEPYLQDVVAVALGRQEKSQVLRALDGPETPASAHNLLLETGYWDESVDPYPERAGLITTSATAVLPSLPDEARRDLTHLLALAIDDRDNIDPDDALSWEDGRLWVHVADAAALVEPDSPADLEARARGANLYVPEGTVTMLPGIATEQLGLGLTDISPALSFGLDLGPEGLINDIEIVPSWVRVTRWSYEEAERRLDEPLPGALLAAADAYQKRRLAQGSIEIDLPEIKVSVQDGQVVLTPLPALRSRDLVREAMLMTGEAIARFALAHDIPLPFTVQEEPRDELPEGEALSVMFARRRFMSPSHQSTAAGPHAGLGMPLYAQATSPLRRYLDLVVHQQLRAFLAGTAVLDEQAILTRIGSVDDLVRSTRGVERLARRHWTLVFLLQNPDWEGDGVVLETRGRRHIVLLPELDMETDLYLRAEQPLDTWLRVRTQNVNLPYLESKFALVPAGHSRE
jgi:exoribonuclease-2